MIEDFLERERSGGEAVGGESTFTLDPQKVRERVAVFCRENSLYPLLRCLQAIILVSRGDLFLQRKEQTWEIRFKWPGCPPLQAFRDLLELGVTAGFDAVGHRVGQHLFFGLSAALGSSDYHLTWTSKEACFQLNKHSVEPLEAAPDEYVTLRFSLEASWWEKLLQHQSITRLEDELRYRLAYSPKTIHLNREQLSPQVPKPPERPWASKLFQGSNLAWRFLKVPDQNFLKVPYPELDFYRPNKEGLAFHLVREPSSKSLPLSVAFHFPERNNLIKGQTRNLSLALSDRAHTALFICLETGRHDWCIPVNDGVLAEPVEVEIGGGGVIALTSEPSLQYDLSGFQVVQNDTWHQSLEQIREQAKAMKKQLALSAANAAIRAKPLPKQYEQALSYLVGGPYAGFLGGRIGPRIRNWLTGGEETDD